MSHNWLHTPDCKVLNELQVATANPAQNDLNIMACQTVYAKSSCCARRVVI